MPKIPKVAKKPRKKADDGLPAKVLDYCTSQGIWAWRANSGAVFTGKRMIVLCEPGTADVCLVIRGRFYGIECKAPKGRQSTNQKLWQAKMESHGGEYCLAFSLEQAIERIEQWKTQTH